MSIKHIFYTVSLAFLPLLLIAQEQSGSGGRNPEMREKMMGKVEAQRIASTMSMQRKGWIYGKTQDLIEKTMIN